MTDTPSIADAAPENWVDRYAPEAARPYLRLMRADRPIGTWLLLWPCLWSAALAAGFLGEGWPNLWHLFLFAVGAFVMRGAGCVYNDIVDKDFDAQVARTAARPIASGQISRKRAWVFLVALSLIGLIVLLQFNLFTVLLGVASLGLVAIYPFMKRVTYWPQAWLGLTFNWGALVGWAASVETLGLAPLFLYVGGIAWTLGYDTIYAHQDKEDDALIGVKSTALRFGENTRAWVAGFYALAILFFGLAAVFANLAGPAYLGVAMMAFKLAQQVGRLDTNDSANCLKLFKSNQNAGAVLFAGYLAGALLA